MSEILEVELLDYDDKPYFTPFELEHILGIPLSDIVEIFAGVPKVAKPAGCYEGHGSRRLIEKWARKRVYADLIGRNAVNATPEIRRLPDEGESLKIRLLDVKKGLDFTVRFPGDLRLYLLNWFAEERIRCLESQPQSNESSETL